MAGMHFQIRTHSWMQSDLKSVSSTSNRALDIYPY